MAEPLEAGVREQRLDSMRESAAGALPTGGVFVPFSDVVERFSWTPDAAVEARRGIGSVDALSHDTGPEAHSAVVAFLMQGAMVAGASLETGGTAVDDQVTWTAIKKGFDGNEITLTLIDGTADAGGISVIDKDIVCEVGTALVAACVALWNSSTALTAIATCAVTDAGTGIVAAAAIATLSAGVSTPLSEAFSRDDDGQIEARTIVLREHHYEGGTALYGKRTYVVLEGCKPASARIPGSPGDAGPIVAEITYTLEKGRQYEISQPSASAKLLMVSSETSDYALGATITVQDDDNTQETIALVLGATTSAEFANIDAIELATEITGTLTVLQGTGAGATLAVIYGSKKYANAEGDLGVPVIPTSGSRTATLGTAYEKFLGDTIEYGTVGSGGTLAYDINSVELSVDNSIEAIPRSNTRKQRILEGNRVLQLTATVLGEAEYQRQITRHLQLEASAIAWTLTGSTITLAGARLTSIGDKVVEAGQAYMSIDNTFEGTAITIA